MKMYGILHSTFFNISCLEVISPLTYLHSIGYQKLGSKAER